MFHNNNLPPTFDQFYFQFTKNIHIPNYARLNSFFMSTLDFPDSFTDTQIENEYKKWIFKWYQSIQITI